MIKLYRSVNSFKKHILISTKIQYKMFWLIFNFLNILIFIATLTITILTILIISKLIFKTYPNWFLLTTTSIAAFSTFFTSLLNFFYIKDKISIFKKRLELINAEIFKYQNKFSLKYQSNDKEYYFFISLASFCNNEAAKKEVVNYEY